MHRCGYSLKRIVMQSREFDERVVHYIENVSLWVLGNDDTHTLVSKRVNDAFSYAKYVSESQKCVL